MRRFLFVAAISTVALLVTTGRFSGADERARTQTARLRLEFNANGLTLHLTQGRFVTPLDIPDHPEGKLSTLNVSPDGLNIQMAGRGHTVMTIDVESSNGVLAGEITQMDPAHGAPILRFNAGHGIVDINDFDVNPKRFSVNLRARGVERPTCP
jgi:hypothetical protein